MRACASTADWQEDGSALVPGREEHVADELEQASRPKCRKRATRPDQIFKAARATSAQAYDPWSDLRSNARLDGATLTLPRSRVHRCCMAVP